MIKVIKNGLVITMDETRKKYEKVDIVVEDDTIKEIVSNYQGSADLVIDAKNKIVLPGLINCHTHLGMSIFRATNDNLALDEWLNNKIWPIEATLTSDDIYYSTLLSCLEMIMSGTVMANDMYFPGQGIVDAVRDSKIRCLFGRCLMDVNGNGEEKMGEFYDLYKANNNPLLKTAMAPHSLYTCSKDFLRRCSDIAIEEKMPLHIHFCETMNEVSGIEKDYGKDPVEALEEIGLLRNKLILAHCTFINPDMLSKFKGHDVSFVHNPISNLNLGCGVADLVKYRDYVNLCLGTDGQGSGNNLNLFYHMSVVDFLQKGLYKDSTVFSSYETLKMATINGAKALGVDKEIGSIEVGKKADIIILDMNNLSVYPTIDVITNVVHNVETTNVDTTMINGEILMQNHKLTLPIDIDELKQKIDDIVSKKMTTM